MSDPTAYLPAAPIQRVIARKKRLSGMSWGEFGDHLGVSPRTLHRVMAATRIGAYAADHMSVRLGLHPFLLWPTEWPLGDTAPAANGPDEGAGT